MISLNNIPLFKGLSPAEQADIRKCLRERKFEKGEVLFLEGKACERIFIILEGRVKLYRMASSGKEQVLETLSAGDTCACNPGSCAWSCSSTAQAMSATTVWFLPREQYVRLVERHAKLANGLNQLLATRLKKFSSLIEEVSLKDVRKRLIKFLLDMQTSSPVSLNGSESTIQLLFTREEVAQRIGTSRETVARYLYELKRKKLIDIHSRSIVIKDRPNLEKIIS